MTNKEKFLALVSNEETKTIERAKARIERRKYSRLSKKIALTILVRLDELGWKQVHLAEKIGVSAQQVNKWVKGNENFTIETLVNLSDILGVELIQVNNAQETIQIAESTKIYVLENYTPAINTIRVEPKFTLVDNRVYENTYAIAN